MTGAAATSLVGAALTVLSIAIPSMSAASTEPDESASTSALEQPAQEFPDDFAPPPGYETLVDDTGRLSVSVPEHWDDIDTAPAEFEGAEVPWIKAATNRRAWDETFGAPGVLYAAFPYTADEEAVYRRFELTSGCRALDVVPYDDGAFAGQWWQHTECGPEGGAEWHAIVASPATEVATVLVVVQVPSADDRAALDVVLQSFNFTAAATWPVATVATTTTSSTSTTIAPSTSTTRATSTTTAAGTRYIVDDTNLLSVTVPSDWSDVTTASGDNDDGSERPTILASPDARAFLGGFEVPGARILALPPDVDPADALANVDYGNNCSSAGTEPYDDGRFTGLRQEWTSCAGGTTGLTVLAARPADDSFTLFAEIQQTADDRSADAVVGSLALVTGSAYPATTVPRPAAPVGAAPDALLHGSVQPGAATVTDSSGSISVAVPAEWTERRLGGLLNDDMTTRPRIVAAPDVDAMFEGWGTPGVIFLEFPYTDAPATLLANLGWADECDDGGLQTFDNGTYTGYLQTWRACDGTETRIVTVAVSRADHAATLYLEVQVPTADDTALQTVLASFQQR